MKRAISALCATGILFLLFVMGTIGGGYLPAQTPAAKADDPAKPAPPTALSEKEKQEVSELMLDLQNAHIQVLQVEAAAKAANEALQTARTAYSARLDTLRKEHKALGMDLDIRKNWTPAKP